MDPTARRNGAARVHDQTWDYDRHGILARRTPSGETAVYIPHTLRRHVPHAIVIHVAADGSDLRRGDTENSIANSPADRSDPKCDPPRFRLLTRIPRPTRERDTHVGLATLLEPNSDDRIPTGTEVGVATISTEELRQEQALDPICKKLLLSTDTSLSYDLNEVGILVRKSPFDGSQQIVVTHSLVSRILYLEHYPPASGHPGAHRMFQAKRKTFFWPRIAEDVYETVRHCALCARNRISEERKTNPLKLFPANGPLESVSMDILRPLPRTKHGNRFLLVISDRYSKVTKTVPLRTVTALSVSRAFCDHWAYVYGPPVSLLTDDGPQSTAKVLQAVCSELGIRKIFTTAYHPHTNGQVERYNQTILASLRGYFSKRQDDWDDFTSAITFACNCRVHSSLGMPPFEITLTRPPLH
jgi:Integrase zinc binding domain/Integrase core domain